MPKFVTPKVSLVGYTVIDRDGLMQYLRDSGNEEFLKDIQAASNEGLSDGEILCSLYAKLCYKSLVADGSNKNITRVRSIHDNIVATLASGHGSVFEHPVLNFVATDCSRVFTHEMVRHRVGTAYSQTSGRYVRGDTINFVLDPILKPVEEFGRSSLFTLEHDYRVMCNLLGLNGLEGLREVCRDPDLDVIWEKDPYLQKQDYAGYAKYVLGVEDLDKLDFAYKKKATSALRRFLPNGQSNEIGFSLNFRTLRHTLMVRTSRHAEWEIRTIFSQVWDIVSKKYPLMFHDAKVERVEGLPEISGMILQPYEAAQA